MKKYILVLFLIHGFFAFSQSLHPLEAVTNHYKALQRLDASPNPERSELDSISFLPSSYGAVALLYTMATPKYLLSSQVEDLKKSIAYPANSSDQTAAELDFLRNWEKKRSPAQEKRAATILAPVGYWPHIDVMKDHEGYEKNLEHLFFEGREIMGAACTADNYPATARLLRGLTNDMRIMEFSAKYHLLRPRPYHLDPKLKTLAVMTSPSFASGHTLWAYIHAFAWSELVPTKRKEFLDLAYEIGESREIMGIHYPSDEEAARVLAHGMLSTMWSNPEFMNDLNAAKQEWKK